MRKTKLVKKAKLDKKDRKILSILIKNARMPLTKIAKKVGLSHDAVRYRINKLKKDRIITDFTAVIDPAKLGFPIWGDVALSLWNLNDERSKEFIKYLKTHPNIVAVWNLSGKFEWFIEIYTETLEEFNNIVSKIKIKFSDIIKDSEILLVMKEIKAKQIYPETYPGL